MKLVERPFASFFCSFVDQFADYWRWNRADSGRRFEGRTGVDPHRVVNVLPRPAELDAAARLQTDPARGFDSFRAIHQRRRDEWIDPIVVLGLVPVAEWLVEKPCD